jgi:filamentous hemagglutinin
VAQLGGMYAGHIYLTSTEHGVGVRNAGSIGASVGQAVVTADGRLENSGPSAPPACWRCRPRRHQQCGELGSQSGQPHHHRAGQCGSIASAGTLAVQASGAVRNTGSIGGEGSVQMTAASLDNRNSIGSSGTVGCKPTIASATAARCRRRGM